MKKIYLHSLWMALLLLGTVSCQENERMIYAEKAAVYFSSVTEKDSISYSFAAGLTDEDVVSIPVKIIGEQVSYDRKIALSVDPASTAEEGTQYKNLPTELVLPAGAVETNINITVMNNRLDEGDVKLILNLKTNDDFDLGYEGQHKAKLIITNQLVKPSYWDMPLSLYYGSYTKAKHQLCIQIQGFDFPAEMDYAYVSDYMSYGRLVYNYLLKTPLWDEETQTWVTADWSPL